MQTITSKLLDNLESIDMHFDEGDDTKGFALQAGYKYPLVKVSSTVLNSSEVEQFELHIGGRYKLPTVTCTISDVHSKFRYTDCIDESTVITLFIGSVRCDLAPVKLECRVVDSQVTGDSIFVTCELNIPTDKVAIANDTMLNMLTSFCEQTGLGLRMSAPHYEQQHIKANYFDMKPIDFLNAFAAETGFEWHIDGQYNVCIHELDALLAEHEELTVTQQFDNYEDLEEPKQVRISSKSPDYKSALLFTRFGYDFIDVDNTVQECTSAQFDAKFDISNATELVSEDATIDKPAPIDVSRLYIELGNNPLLLYDRTYAIDVYTELSYFKRQSFEDSEAGQQPESDQQFIEDMSGIYKLDEIRYCYPGDTSGFDCKCSFIMPPSIAATSNNND